MLTMYNVEVSIKKVLRLGCSYNLNKIFVKKVQRISYLTLIKSYLILNHWVHHYCRKQRKTSKTHRLLNKVLLSLTALLSVYCDLCLLHLPQQKLFSVLGHSTPRNHVKIWTLNVVICAKNTFIFWFENGFLQVKPS